MAVEFFHDQISMKEYSPDVRIEPATVRIPSERASDPRPVTNAINLNRKTVNQFRRQVIEQAINYLQYYRAGEFSEHRKLCSSLTLEASNGFPVNTCQLIFIPFIICSMTLVPNFFTLDIIAFLSK